VVDIMAAADLTEFYRQLHLLTQSNLPLPESLRQLADNARRPAFRRVLADLAEQTAGGRPLAAAMAVHPHQFDPSFVRMIAASEAAGTLPETLAEIAGLAAAHGLIVEKTRSIAIMPVFVILFSILIYLGLLGVVVPDFMSFYDDVFYSHRLPLITLAVFKASTFVARWLEEIFVGYVLLLAYCIWLFSGMAAARQQLLALIRHIPLAGNIFRQLQVAQACSLWSVLMKLKMPLPEVLATVSDLVDDPPLAAAAHRLSDVTQQGRSLADAMDQEPCIPGILRLTVHHTPEVELPKELDILASLFRDNANIATNHAAAGWEVILIVFTSVLAGSVIIALFSPLVAIVKLLGS
jgi:type IV pilus assembly protein PilC